MVALIPRLLQDLPEMRAHDRVGGEDEPRLLLGWVVDLGLVDVAGLGLGREEDIFEGRQALVLVLG